MSEKLELLGLASTLWNRVVGEVFTSAGLMPGTVIASAAFGGFCLFMYRVIAYYKELDHDLWSKEHALALLLIVFSFIGLPIFGVAFAGIYGITNLVAAWQIGLTTPMLIESVYTSYGKKAREGKYNEQFLPSQADA